MADAAIWTGTLRRGDQPGTVVITIVDTWGWILTLQGVHQADGSYTLEGRLGNPPAHLAVPAVDGE